MPSDEPDRSRTERAGIALVAPPPNNGRRPIPPAHHRRHGDCARNESDRASVVYSCGEDVEGEEGAGRGPGDPESRAGPRGQGCRDVRGDAGIT